MEEILKEIKNELEFYEAKLKYAQENQKAEVKKQTIDKIKFILVCKLER